MSGDHREVAIGRQHRQVVAKAKLRQQRIDRADLHARAPAYIAQFGRRDVVLPCRYDQWQRGKAVEKARPVARPGEALQQFLEHQPRRDQRLVGLDGADQRAHFAGRGRCIATQRQRPDAGVDKEAHSRDRSAL